MPENNDSFDNLQQPIVNIHQLETQLHCEDFDPEDDDNISRNCLKWTNWYFFILPARIRELREKAQREHESEEKQDEETQDYERFIPKTRTGRMIGVMQYILQEEGNISIEEMLYIDFVLRRINSFNPQMAGIDRYDDMGIVNLRRGFRRFVEDFFSLPPKIRQKTLSEFEDFGVFSSEILQSVNRLKNLANIPQTKKTPAQSSTQEKSVRCWPDGLAGRDLELFKLLSGMETMSPRSQALSVLNFILPEERPLFSRKLANSFDDSDSEVQSDPIRLEPGDKKRVARLLKRFPALKNRYPYLLKMIENEIPQEKFNASSDNQEHLYSDWLSSSLIFPSVLADPPKESKIKKLFSNGVIKWSVIIAAVSSLIKLAGILLNVLIKQ